MAAPTIDWLRPGVGYTPLAAASMRRLEAELGRPHDCNSSYRDWDTQQRMHDAYQRYMKGQGPYPGHSYALPPSQSRHCLGLADDSDDWTTPGYIALAARHGWIRTAAGDPTERHHFEYQVLKDKHFGQTAGSGSVVVTPPALKEEDPEMFQFMKEGSVYCLFLETKPFLQTTTSEDQANAWARILNRNARAVLKGTIAEAENLVALMKMAGV